MLTELKKNKYMRKYILFTKRELPDKISIQNYFQIWILIMIHLNATAQNACISSFSFQSLISTVPPIVIIGKKLRHNTSDLQHMFVIRYRLFIFVVKN